MSSLSWPDLAVLAIVVLSAYAATRRGFVAVLLSLAGFVVALFVSFSVYPGLATWLTERFGWPPIWSKPVAFVGLWFLVEVVFESLERLLTVRSGRTGYALRRSAVNRALAVIPGAVQGLLISAVLLTLLALLPLQGTARQSILSAPVSGKLVNGTLSLERPLEGIFGPAAREALGFITVLPPNQQGEPGEKGIKLNFTVDNPTTEPSTEEAMLVLVNQERTSRGLVPLVMDEPLRAVARAHAADMFKRGYFAHDTPEGVDPFQRMRDANIAFGLAGENLALAPALDIAHDGLMNSPGHRANILNPGFRKAGIGVLDGGIYGKIFVQEFTD